jgi:L-2-hydroxyglutarate oxidase
MVEARYNVVVIGGGIVGLAVALEITRRFPRLRRLLVEKEEEVAHHQSGANTKTCMLLCLQEGRRWVNYSGLNSGHNSGVIHSGVYYKPGSLNPANVEC